MKEKIEYIRRKYGQAEDMLSSQSEASVSVGNDPDMTYDDIEKDDLLDHKRFVETTDEWQYPFDVDFKVLVSGQPDLHKDVHEEERSRLAKVFNKPLPLKKFGPAYREQIAYIESTLQSRYPYMGQVNEYIGDMLSINGGGSSFIHIPPTLLVGAPGLGKTSYWIDLAGLMGLEWSLVDVGSMTSGFILTGSHPTWRSSTCGAISKCIMQKNISNSIVILDEIDKLHYRKENDVESPILNLLEKNTAKMFKDEYFGGIEFDASVLSFLATANDTLYMSEPLLSRLKVFHIPSPTREQKIDVIDSMWKELLSNYKLEKAFESYSIREDLEVMDILTSVDSFRSIKSFLSQAIGKALKQQYESYHLTAKIVGDLIPEKKRSIGFH